MLSASQSHSLKPFVPNEKMALIVDCLSYELLYHNLKGLQLSVPADEYKHRELQELMTKFGFKTTRIFDPTYEWLDNFFNEIFIKCTHLFSQEKH